MKVTINGNNPVTSEQVKWVIDELNKEYAQIGLNIKNMTCYIRFVDETGRIVEPVEDGCNIEKIFTMATTKDVNHPLKSSSELENI